MRAKHQLLFTFTWIALLSLMIACSGTAPTPTPPASQTPRASATAPLANSPVVPTSNLIPTLTAAPPSSVPSDAELRAFIARMPLEDKVGQMMLAGFGGKTLASSPDLPKLISNLGIGGVVLLETNAHDPAQIVALTGDAQALALRSRSRLPLFVSMNHEGGIVVRITEGITGFPGNMALGATNREDYAYTAASLAARELRAVGINMNLAPVLDVNDNPLNPIIGARSFGESPELVEKLGRQTIRGFQQNGVIAVAKHFPGHGSAAVDSHVGLPLINKNAAQLERTELPPFSMAIQEGVEGIMSAHIVVPALEPTPGLPATLSSRVLTDLLRGKMNFQGIILTDSLGMAGVTANRTQGEAAVEAVRAGADIVISTSEYATQAQIHQALVAAVRSGKISSARIDESILRIVRVKYEYGLFNPKPLGDLTQVNSSANQAVADQIALDAVTLYRNAEQLVPLPDSKKRVLLISPSVLPLAAQSDSTLLAQALRQHGRTVTEFVYDLDRPDSKDRVQAAALNSAADSDVVIFGEWELIKRWADFADHWQEDLVTALRASGKPVIMISWHNPAAILRVPQVSTYLIAYGNTIAQVRAVAKILNGEAVPGGRLPLTLPLP